jgi:peptidoglycan/xylan/chitin deacetylase (PgdA/CDA1 family)
LIPAVTAGRYHEPGERETHPLGAEKIRFLRQAVDDGAVDCALHGFNHRSRVHSSPHSEFAGLSTQEQIARLQQSQDLLRRLTTFEPSVFVPPWNSYDERTLEALVHQRLACISANRHGPFQAVPLRFVPITTDIPSMRDAIDVARTVVDEDAIVGVLMHPYDFDESGDPRAVITCSGFDQQLQWLVAQSDIRVASVSELAARNQTLDGERYVANAPSRIESVFPPFVRTTDQTPVYRSTTTVERTKRRSLIAALSMHVAAAIFGGLAAAASWAWLTLPASGIAATAAVAALALVSLLVRAGRSREIFFRSSILSAVLTGVIVASLMSVI